ncbi:ABC transporter permease [Streptomyces phaeoluteigriseus]|uniref:ABC transporter permease n=2 Tax=Streptomyces phaeoluteigriseus TaxID=114686 RepID=A0ABY4ZKD0_9ACTN|nr:ABC transporter permease [Streptomyces phaeoluteigriseus]USQ89395.1 ABC transporter permease [Streptomyces phaeoluteigriseus]
MVLTTLMAVTASVLAVGLLVAARAPFDRAFTAQRGAHLTGQFDGTEVTAERLARTADAAGVAAVAGPFRSVPVRVRTASDTAALPAGVDLPPVTVVGRADPGGPVDRLRMVDGRWATRPGEIVLADGTLPAPPGARLTLPTAPGTPTLTVVGIARSVTDTAQAWVTPAQAEVLAATNGTTAGYEMLYRFRHAERDADVAAGRAAITAAVPPDALSGSQSYLAVEQQRTANARAFVPFLAAFGVLGLLLSVLVVGIVISGAVGAATRRIGILKSLGFTPAQVVRAYVGQALLPAAVGCLLGLALGNALAVPVLGEVGEAFDAPVTTVPLWIDVVVPAGALLLVAGAALLPALRAGRLSTVAALGVGRTVGRRPGAARSVRRLTARLPLPRAVGLGLADPFARPARSGTMAAAVAFGAVCVTFAVGLALSLGVVQAGRMLNSAGSVVVQTGGGTGPPGAQIVHAGAEAETPKADPEKIAAVLRAQEGTGRFYGTARAELSVRGITGATTVVAYQGDSAWGAPRTVAGRWLDGPGEAVVTSRFLEAAGIGLGDTLRLTERGRHASVRIVGEAFFTEGEGMALLTSTTTLADLGLDARPGRYDVQTEAGTDAARYLGSLRDELEGVGAVAQANTGNSSSVILAMDALIGMLTLMLVVVAGLGVLNTVVLDTRERVRDLGVLKALGMTPRQTVAMVVTSVAGTGLLAGLVAVPAGVALHHWIIPLMGDAVGMNLPTAALSVYDPQRLTLLALGGLVIAVAGGLLPATWAARTDTATALRSE